jgi:hypothetical protein
VSYSFISTASKDSEKRRQFTDPLVMDYRTGINAVRNLVTEVKNFVETPSCINHGAVLPMPAVGDVLEANCIRDQKADVL